MSLDFIIAAYRKVQLDVEDAIYFGGVTWTVNTSGYVLATDTKSNPWRNQCLHVLVAKRAKIYVPGLMVDHKDGNKLNCRRGNLRPATRSQNGANQQRGGKLPKGVHLVNGRYRAKITVEGRYIFLGSFDTVEEASAAYRDSAIKHFGDFARA